MSYATLLPASAKPYYASVVDGFYNTTVYNPSTNMMTTVSSLPIKPSLIPAANAQGMTVTESLTCESQNKAYRCQSPMDCPGKGSKCPNCVQHKCVN